MFTFRVPKGVLLLTVPQHIWGLIGAAYYLYFGLLPLHTLALTYVFWVLLGVVGMGIFFHKYWSHQSFTCSQVFAYIGTYLGCLCGMGPPIFWVALHNNHHHSHADQYPKDVHSPVAGLFSSYLMWHFKPFKLDLRGTRTLFNSRYLSFMTRYYYWIYWLSIAGLFLIKPWLPIFLILLPGCIHFHVESIIATFCHDKRFGYRNFETADNSVNIYWLGLLSWGSAFHNNHHQNPRAWDNATHPLEVDFSALIVRMIKRAS